MNTDLVIKQIQLITKNRALSNLELERLAGELNAVHQRLDKGDYQRFSYTSNVFDAPNRAQDFFTELEFYCLLGRTWAAILKELDVNQYTSVADLCPGYTPKIELALYYLGYTGQVDILDSDGESTSHIEKFMALFNSEFAIKTKIINLFGNFDASYDLVLGNHIFDDLVLYHATQKTGIPLSDAYASEQKMVELWQDIIDNKQQYLDEVVPHIAEVFLKAVNPGGYLCVSQYKSYMEKMLGIDEAPHFNQQVFTDVIQQLEQQGFVQEPDKLDRAFQNFTGHFGPDNCVILKRQ